MNEHITRLIQDCYDEHDGDGSFVRDDRAIPFKAIRPPTGTDRAILFARKTQVIVEALGCKLESNSPGFLGRAALPSPDDDPWIRAFVKGHRLFFLGDLGPADLMYFAWLRQRFQCTRVKYLGINDSYLKELGVLNPLKITFGMTESQQQAMIPLESAFPDWHDIVGPECAEVLRSGNTIDLEGIVGHCGSISSLVTPSFFK